MLSDDEVRKALPGGGMTDEQIEALIRPMREAYRKRPNRPAPPTLYDRFRAAQKEKPKPIATESIVYFIRCNQFVKIGFTINLKSRLYDLQPGNPYPLQVMGVVPGGCETEANIHRALVKNRDVGEWFRLSKPVRQMLVRLLDEAELGPGHLKAAEGVKIEPLDERLRTTAPSGSHRIRWVKKRGKKFNVHE